MRLTLLYGCLFLLSGAGLLAITYVLVQNATESAAPTGGDPARAAQQGVFPGAGPAPEGQELTGAQVDVQARMLESQAAQQRSDQMRQLVMQSGVALSLMSVASIGLGWAVAGRVLRPLRTITTAAREISATNLHERLDLQGPDDELKELGDTFDDLLARLDASFQSQRRFMANASHELRTPVAWQRTLVQVTLSDPDATADSLRTAHEQVLRATYQQERLIDALFTLARGERGLDRRQPLDLAEVTDQVLLARGAEATRREVRLVPALQASPILGDPQLVERLVANLVDNGLRYNAAPGRLEISTGTTDDGAVLSVTNTGAVVPADQVDRLFQPFERLDADRAHHDGLGLGLSIVKAIATAHGATIHARPNPTGGIVITVTFPATDTGQDPRKHLGPGRFDVIGHVVHCYDKGRTSDAG